MEFFEIDFFEMLDKSIGFKTRTVQTTFDIERFIKKFMGLDAVVELCSPLGVWKLKIDTDIPNKVMLDLIRIFRKEFMLEKNIETKMARVFPTNAGNSKVEI